MSWGEQTENANCDPREEEEEEEEEELKATELKKYIF